MGRPPEPYRRDEVLAKAVTYLAEHGLSNLSMRKLASAMGTSTNAISYQFGSKENLIEAALETARLMTLARLTELREAPGMTVSKAVVDLWDWWMDDPRNLLSTRLRMEAMVASDEDVPPGRRPELLSFWLDYFSDWIAAERGLSPQLAYSESTLLMAVLSGLVIDAQSTGDRERTRAALLRYMSR